MSDSVDDPHCPECGEPIGQTATYCMHCSADLSDRQAASGSSESWDSEPVEAESSGSWAAEPTESGSSESWEGESTEAESSESFESEPAASEKPEYMRDSGEADEEYTDQILHPDGLVDNTLTVVVGIVGGILVGIVGTIFFMAATWDFWGLLPGVVVWLGATGYLVRRPTVQTAVAHGCFGIAIALLVIPLIAFSPFLPADGGLSQRVNLFISYLVFAGIFAVPAGIAGGIAYYFVPENDGSVT